MSVIILYVVDQDYTTQFSFHVFKTNFSNMSERRVTAHLLPFGRFFFSILQIKKASV
jgi:hypothetical protein